MMAEAPNRDIPARDQRRQQEFWTSLLPTIQAIISGIDSLPAAYAEGVLRSIKAGDTRKIDGYFRKQFSRQRTPEELLALYTILNRSETWRKVKGLDLTKYLGQSVWLEGERIRLRWQMDGILTPEQAEKERQAATEHGRRRTHILGPDRQLARKEASEFRGRVLKRVSERIRQKGSDRDRAILALRERGLMPAEIVRNLGVEWAAWQAFQRKRERWGIEERKILRLQMSSKHISAA